MTTEELTEAQAEAHAEFRELAVDYWGINKDVKMTTEELAEQVVIVY